MAARSRTRRVRDEEPEEDYLPEDDDAEFEDDEEDEAPRRSRKRRSRRDEEDEDEPRARRSRRSRDDEDDEDDEDESPRRGRKRRARDEDDDEEPRRSRKRRPRDDDDEDDADDEPRARGKKKKGRGSGNVGGWGQYKNTKQKTSTFAAKFKPSEDETLVKFIDDEPFASYAIHWFDELKGKKGWMCLESLPEPQDCPGCKMGDRPSGKALFTVVVFDEHGNPTARVLEAGTRLGDQLEGQASGKNGPLSKHYWCISATGGKGGRYSVNLSVVKERDVEEDWDFPPLDDDELADFEEATFELDDVEQIPSRKDFLSAVRSLDD